MSKTSRFTGFGIEDDAEDKQQGLDSTTDNAEPTSNNVVNEPAAVTDDVPSDETPAEEPTEETPVEDLEIKEDDSEEVVEEKTKKIKIEIEIAQEGISTAFSAIASLEKICDEMQNSLQKGGLNSAGRNIASTTIQHVTKSLKINNEYKSSLEDYGYPLDDFHATRVSIESIKEAIMKVIQWIRDKIKALLDFMFKRDTVERLKEQLRNAKREIDENKTNLSTAEDKIESLRDKLKEREKEHENEIKDLKIENNHSAANSQQEKQDLLHKMEKLKTAHMKELSALNEKIEKAEKKNAIGRFIYEIKCQKYVTDMLFKPSHLAVVGYNFDNFVSIGLQGIKEHLDKIEKMDFNYYEGNPEIYSSEAGEQWDSIITIKSSNDDTWETTYARNVKVVEDKLHFIENYNNIFRKLLETKENQLNYIKPPEDDNLDPAVKDQIENLKKSIKYIKYLWHAFAMFNDGVGSIFHDRNFVPTK